MNSANANGVDRRAWLATCARTAVLGGLAAAGGVLIGRGQIGGCANTAIACAACGQLPRCTLPAAAAARDARHAQEER